MVVESGNKIFQLARGIRNWWVSELEDLRIMHGSRALGMRIYQKRKAGIITEAEYVRRLEAVDRFGYYSSEALIVAHNLFIDDMMKQAGKTASLKS